MISISFLVLGENPFYLRRKKTTDVKFWQIIKENLRITQGFYYYYFPHGEAANHHFPTSEQQVTYWDAGLSARTHTKFLARSCLHWPLTFYNKPTLNKAEETWPNQTYKFKWDLYDAGPILTVFCEWWARTCGNGTFKKDEENNSC